MCDNSKKGLICTWIEDFVRKRRFSKYELMETEHGSKGDGYLGDVTFVKVLTGIGREQEKIYNLVIKSSKSSDELRKQTPIAEVFDREILMYSKVFPAFQTFQLEKAIQNPFMKYPKCYSVSNEDKKEAILLQNLKLLGYDLHDRKLPQNLEHVTFVFKNYAKFHALSLAFRKQKPNLYKDLTRNMTNLQYDFMVQINMSSLLANDFKNGLELLKDTDKITYQKLKHIDENFIKTAMFKIKDPVNDMSVILHGDCWNNNMMFAYTDPSKSQPSDMMFLDFQLSTLGSPIYDLSTYLYAVADDKVLKHFDLLLYTYHYTLTSFLKELGESSYDITLEDLKRHWIEYGKCGLVLAPLTVKVELSEKDEVVDIAESAATGNITQAFNIKIRSMDTYNQRIIHIYKHFASLL